MTSRRMMKWAIAVAGLILVCAASASAQRLDVKIVDRQDKEDSYDYVAVYNNVAVGKSFKVHGATFTLQLPDGRLAIVNCESKFAEHMAGPVGNRRSCRAPVVENIQADFNGGNAKLIWPVSLDGRKMQSETYRILGIMDAPIPLTPDPALAAAMRTQADEGKADAQFRLGSAYLNGEGLPRDVVQAYMWLTLAVSRSAADEQKIYSDVRDSVARIMTPVQIADAQRLAREWKPQPQK